MGRGETPHDSSSKRGSSRLLRWIVGIGIAAALYWGCTTWVGSGDVGLPVILVPVAYVYSLWNHIGENGGSIGEPLVGSGSSHSVSDRFGKPELQRLYARLTSDAFQATLTNYNCGDPVPRFQYAVTLMRQRPASARRVEVTYAPSLAPAGRMRCLMFRVGEMIDKAVSEIDPAPTMPQDNEYVMQCDCSKRDGTEEWVTWVPPSTSPR